jgi:hypothetical protein
MESLRKIEELNWALKIYTSVIKFGFKKNSEEEARETIKILEEFEEYEKCSLLLETVSKISQKKGGSS